MKTRVATDPRGNRLLRAIAIAALLAYGWWFTDLQPFTAGSLFAMFGAAAALLALATTRHHADAGRARESRDAATIAARGFVTATVMWLSIIVGALAWELIAFISRPRSQHPTISTLVDSAEAHQPLRFAVYALWLALGWAIAS